MNEEMHTSGEVSLFEVVSRSSPPLDINRSAASSLQVFAMTPLDCCEIGANYAATGKRDLASLEAAARLHAQSQLDAGELERELRSRPEIVDGWLRWVEDKRWSPAWYLSPTDDGRYVVGYFSTDETEQTQTFFNDAYSACAAFIIHELEDYRLLRESKGKW